MRASCIAITHQSSSYSCSLLRTSETRRLGTIHLTQRFRSSIRCKACHQSRWSYKRMTTNNRRSTVSKTSQSPETPSQSQPRSLANQVSSQMNRKPRAKQLKSIWSSRHRRQLSIRGALHGRISRPFSILSSTKPCFDTLQKTSSALDLHASAATKLKNCREIEKNKPREKNCF